MYPYELFFGLHLYDIMMVLGFFAALIWVRFFADRRHIEAAIQNLVIISATAALIGGYGSAVLFQAFYNYLESGIFEIVSNTGATFYGGLIGGVGIFIAVYFAGGAIFCKQSHVSANFLQVSELAAGAIALAHGFGRIGCLFAGCCHGRVTDAWYGIYNVYLDAKTVPVQLFEALFLFTLAGFLGYRTFREKRGNLGIYLSAYAVWRFFVEYLRTDDRGESFIAVLTPSQLTAICLLAVGVLVYILAVRKKGEESTP